MLTAKQHQLLSYIDRRLSESGVSPSFDEMKEALGLKSKSGIHRLITALEERGFIRRLPNKARALEVLKHPDGASARREAGAGGAVLPFPKPKLARDADAGMVEIPLHGKIAAGTPIEALEMTESTIRLPPDLIGSGAHFALTVEGDSMIEAGILDGDTILIQSTETARDGEIVVALVDDSEATLKTLRKMGPQVALIPSNRRLDTQIYDAGRVRVQGRLVGLLRRY